MSFSSHDTLATLVTMVPANRADAHASLNNIKETFAYSAPEREDKRWDCLWTFVVEHVVPHDREPWTSPIKTYWHSVVPTVGTKDDQGEQAQTDPA